MRKFYLYAAIIISLFSAGFALAARTDLFYFTEAVSTDALKAEKEEESTTALNDCPAVTINWDRNNKNQHSPQTRCDKHTDGKLSVSLSPSNGNYTVEWYETSLVGDPAGFKGIGTSLSGIEAGSYTVVVKVDGTDCVYRRNVQVDDETPDMRYKANIVNDVIGCDGQGFGELSLTMLADNSQNAHSAWYDETGKELKQYSNQLGADNLTAGTYTIIVKNSNTQCEGIPFVITIGQLTPPAIAGTVTDNTLCEGGNGAINLTITTDGPPPSNGFDVSWSGPVSGSISGITSTYDLTNLPGGTYTVTATDPVDANCTSTATFVVQEDLTYPAIAQLEAMPSTVCIPTATNGGYNGTITATASVNGQAITDFSDFELSLLDADGNVLTTGSTNIFENLAGGNYQVSITNTITGCTSGLASVNVPVQQPSLSLNLTADNQTNCEGTPNGLVDFTISRNGTEITDYQNYSLSWYRGISSTTGTAFNPTMRGNTATGLAGGHSYTLLVTDPATGCTVEEMVTVALALPVLALEPTASPNTICADNDFDGSITAAFILDDNTVTDYTGYTFIWTLPNGNEEETSTNTLSSLEQGTYQIKIRNIASGCESEPVDIEVPFTPAILDLNLVPVAQTTCSGTPDGSVQVKILIDGNEVSDYSNYSYEWYRGIDAATGTSINPGMEGNKAKELKGEESYTVVVTDANTGCKIEKMVNVGVDNILPVITPTITKNQGCETGKYTGKIELTVTEGTQTITDFTNYEFTWTNLDSGTAPVTNQSNTLSDLKEGNYKVKVKNIKSGCTTEITEYVGEDKAALVLDLVPGDQTYCSGTPNGSVEVKVFRDTNEETDFTNYSFSWFRGISSATGTPISPAMEDNKATELSGNISYTVVVKDEHTGCTVESMVYVTENKVYPAISPAITPNTGCETGKYTGKIELTVTEGTQTITDFTNYEFTWTNVDAGTAPVTNQSNTLSDLKEGNYKVKVKNTVSGCEFESGNIYVPEDKATLDLDLNATAQSNCEGPDNGQILAVFSIDGTDVTDYNGYTFNVYEGNTITGSPIRTIQDDNEVTGLSGDKYYTITVSNPASGCVFNKPVYVPKNLVKPTISAQTDPNTVCDPDLTTTGKYTGKITITVTNAGTDDTYSYEWRKSDGTLINVPDNTSNELDELPDGQYRVIVKNDNTKCSSTELVVEVGSNKVIPAIAVSRENNIACAAHFTGKVKVSVGGVDNPAGYSYEWFTDAPSTTGISSISTAFEVDQLDAGTYWVRVTDDATGCQTVASGTVQSVITDPEVSLAVKVPVSCGPDAQLEATVDNNGGTANYSFIWYRGQTDDPAQIIPNQTSNLLDTYNEDGDPLLAGFYTVVLKNNDSKCLSEPKTVSLAPPPPAFEIKYELVSQTNTCNVNGGVVTAYVYNPADPNNKDTPSEYTFTWYEGSPIDPDKSYYTNPIVEFPASAGPLELDDASNSAYNNLNITGQVQDEDYFQATSLITGQTLYNRSAGNYSVVVENTNTGCKEWIPVNLPFVDQDFGSIDVDEHIEDCDDASVGSLKAFVRDPNGNPYTDQTVFRFYLYEGTSTNGSEVPGNPISGGLDGDHTIIPGLSQGWYTVVAYNINDPDQCKSIEGSAEIKLVAAEPSVGISGKSPNISCVSPYTGQFTISVGPGEYEPGEVDPNTKLFEISISDPNDPTTSNVIIYSGSSTVSAGNYPVTGLEEGEYTIWVKGFKSDGVTETCAREITTTLGKNTPLPLLTASASNQNECSPPNGSAWVTEISFDNHTYGSTTPTAADFSDFTFTWYASEADYLAGDVLEDINGNPETGFEITGQPAGTYYVTASKLSGLSAGCPSAPATVSIQNVSTLPIISFAQTPNKDCDVPSGELEATVLTNGVNTSNYTFVWYEGEGTSGAIISATVLGTNKQKIIGQSAGKYTLWAQDGNCTPVIETFEVESELSEPYISGWGNPVPNTNCAPETANGSFEVTTITYNGQDFTSDPNDSKPKIADNFDLTFYTVDPIALDLSDPNNVGPTVPTNITNLGPGTYYLIATKKTNPGKDCGKLPFTFVIDDNPPVLSLNLSSTPNDLCALNSGNGTFKASLLVNGLAPASGTAVDWRLIHIATDGTETTEFTGTGTAELEVNNLTAGNYRVEATHATGCTVSDSYEVEQRNTSFNMSFSTTANTACSDAEKNGGFTVKSITHDGTLYDTEALITANFSLVYYENENDYHDPAVAGQSLDLNNPPKLHQGTYVVVATKLNGTGTDCASTPFSVTVPHNPINPVLSLDGTANQACDDSDANGTIKATLTENGGVLTQAYEIKWFKLDENNSPVPLASAVPSADISDPLEIKKLPAGTYRAAVTLENDCYTEEDYEVQQQASTFNMSLSATANTACADDQANGSFIINSVTHNGNVFTGPSLLTEFSFKYYPEDTPATVAPLNSVTLSSLKHGTYKVIVTKTVNPGADCEAEFSITLSHAPVNPLLNLIGTASEACDDNQANGTITARLTENGGTPAAGYTVKWFSVAIGQETAVDAAKVSADQLQVSGLPAGNYKAVATLANGCSVERTYEVKQQASTFNMSLSASANTACADDQANGSFTITSVTHNGEAFTGVDIMSKFSFVYYNSEADYQAGNAAGTLSAATVSSLNAGTYVVVATKLGNPGANCESTAFIVNVPHQPFYPSLSLSGTNNNACFDDEANGEIRATVNAGNPAQDYTISWFLVEEGGDAPLPNTAVANGLQLSNLLAGTYKAVVSLKNGCPVSATYRLSHEVTSFDMQLATAPHVGCENGGEIRISRLMVNGSPAPLGDFTYNWYKKDANGNLTAIPVPANTTALTVANYSDIEAGNYRVEAVKIANPAAGCGPVKDVTIPFTNTQPEITVNHLQPLSGCNPDSRGMIDISVNSPIGNDLTVRWFSSLNYEENSNNWTALPQFNNQLRIDDLAGAYYYVEVTDPATSCSEVREFLIEADVIEAIMSASAQDLWKCYPENGEIYIFMVNHEKFTFSYPDSRFDVAITRAEDGLVFNEVMDLSQSHILHLFDFGVGTYHISYTETGQNKCPVDMDTVVIDDISVRHDPLIVQTDPYTVCDEALANASLSATVEGGTEGYTFAWYEGEVDESTTDEPVSRQATATGLKAMTYTVIATSELTGCTTLAEYTIKEEPIAFTPDIEQDVLLTVCDPALANAELSASVNGTTSGYAFEWFTGQADLSTDAALAISNEARAGGLGDTTYTVRVTDLSTGCMGLASHKIEVDFPVIPADSSWIISHPTTSCLYPNGSLEIGVDSLYSNYTVHWYKGADAHPDSLIASGVFAIDSLTAGIYSVTITSQENGCTSTSFTRPVGEDYYFPRYKVNIKPSTCVEEGSAEVVDLEGKIPHYEWYSEDRQEMIDKNTFFSGPAGKYWLRIVSDLGCVKWVPVEINEVVDPYNAVSLNGDGINEYFHIGCIELFPQNRVRIYNRAGTLVYETLGYDNRLNAFEGRGNKGVYVSGRDLPVGTYFYVVDKGYNNEKPQTGFLELIR